MTTVTRRVDFAFKGNRKRAIPDPEPATASPTGRIPRVSKLMALAIRFDGLLQRGVVTNQSDLARLARVTQPRMTQIMNLLHLAPDIQEDILFLPAVMEGRDPLSERDLRHIVREIAWGYQRQAWRRQLSTIAEGSCRTRTL